MRLKTLAVVLTSALLTSQFVIPCSTFMLKKGKYLIVGHNLDMPFHIQGHVVINKRNVRKQGTTWFELETGNKSPSPALTWVSKYGSVTFNPMGKEFPDGGMNEAGLFIGEMNLGGTRFPKNPSRPTVFMMQWIQYVLDCFETVDQVIESTSRVMLDGWNWHFFAADGKGNAAVIEFLEGEVVVYSGEKLPVPVLCNQSYEKQMKQLSRYSEFGGDWEISPADKKHPRFAQGAYMIKHYNPGAVPAVAYGFKILEYMSRKGTQWSFICDLENLRAYFRTARSDKIKEVALTSFDLDCTTPAKILDIHSDLSGDVSGKFRDADAGQQEKLLQEAFDTISTNARLNEKRKEALKQQHRGILKYSKITVCDKK